MKTARKRENPRKIKKDPTPPHYALPPPAENTVRKQYAHFPLSP